jgi:thiol-disulfide isomerase/thioredoxin
MVSQLVRFSSRLGGVLVRPRATMASLRPDEGMRDGLWLGLLYLLGGHVYPLIEAVATLVAVRNWGGVLGVFASFGVLLAPILASIVAETILGSERGQRAGLCLAPLVVVSLAAHGLARLGVSLPVPGWSIAPLGIAASVWLAFWLRHDDVKPGSGTTPSSGKLVGLLVLASVIVLGGADLRRGLSRWSQLGPLPPGEQVEDFRLVMLDGEVFVADDLVGKVSVVTFWATWCGVCVSELPDLDALSRRYTDQPVQFIAVNREGGDITLAQAVGLVRSFAAQRGLGLPFAIDDGSMARAFRVGPIPHTVVFDATGTVRHVHQGRVTSATLADEIDALVRRGS